MRICDMWKANFCANCINKIKSALTWKFETLNLIIDCIVFETFALLLSDYNAMHAHRERTRH